MKAAAAKSEASFAPLWKWTAVSAVGHAVFLAIVCLVSYHLEQQKKAEAKVKAEQKAAEMAAAEKAAAEKAAAEKKKNPPPADAGKAAATPAGTNTTAAAETTTNDVKKAEKILGIDKVASPDELKKGFKPKDADDLLKDLK